MARHRVKRRILSPPVAVAVAAVVVALSGFLAVAQRGLQEQTGAAGSGETVRSGGWSFEQGVTGWYAGGNTVIQATPTRATDGARAALVTSAAQGVDLYAESPKTALVTGEAPYSGFAAVFPLRAGVYRASINYFDGQRLVASHQGSSMELAAGRWAGVDVFGGLPPDQATAVSFVIQAEAASDRPGAGPFGADQGSPSAADGSLQEGFFLDAVALETPARGSGLAKALETRSLPGMLVAVGLVLAGTLVTAFAGRWQRPLVPAAASVLLPWWQVGGAPADNWVTVGFMVAAAPLLRRRWPPSTRGQRLLVVGFGVLAVAAAGSALLHDLSDVTFAVRLLSVMVALLLASSLSDREHVWLLRGLLGVGLVLTATVVMGRFEYVRFPGDFIDRENGGYRSGGAIGHSSFAGYYLALLTVILAVSPRIAGWKVRVVLGTAFALALGLTNARAAVLCVAVGLVAALPSVWRSQGRRSSLLLGTGLTLLGGGLVLGLGVGRRFGYLFSSGGLEGENSFGWRLMQWQDVWAVRPDVPVLGLGWTHSREFVPTGAPPHNGYLQVLVELGAVGAVGLLLVLFASFVLGVRTWRSGGLAVPLLMVTATVADPGWLYPALTYTAALVILGPSPEVTWRRRGHHRRGHFDSSEASLAVGRHTDRHEAKVLVGAGHG